MSEFLSPLDERLIDPFANDGTGLWQLLAPFHYYSSRLKRRVEIPLGFTYDHASVPRVPGIYAMFGNRYHRPACIHDFLCRQGYVRRETADLVFLEAMRLQNKEEIEHLRESGEDDDAIMDRKIALEGRAKAMYAAVAFYTKTGMWKTDVDEPGFEPLG